MSLLILFPAPAAQPTTGTASFSQSETWGAAVSEKLTAVISASQLSAWVAAAAEKQPAIASFAQVQTWDALSAERLAATATFDQSATWAGQGSSQQAATTGTATFTQNAVVWQSYHKLKIMGYASKVIPAEYANATGTPIEVVP